MAPPPPPRTLSPSSSSPSLRSSGRRPLPSARLVGRWVQRPSCSLSMNGCGAAVAGAGAVAVRETRALPAAGAAGDAVGQLREAVAALEAADPPASPSGIIRIEVPVRQRGDAVEWLHAQGDLRARCFFSARAAAPLPECPALAIASAGNGNGNGAGGVGGEQRQRPVSVAGVGSAVFFRGTEPFSLRDWRAIKRFLPRDCPLIRAYGAIRFDATSDHSVEWEEFGSFYFIVPQVEYNELEESSVLATTIAWDDSLSWTWQNAVKELQSTLQKISSSPIKVNNSTLQTTILNLNHVPTKASWDLAVTKALQMIKGKQRELVKVVLARCSRYITDTCIDPVELLACLKVEGQNAYQFCIQPPDAPAFVGNSPEQLFHRKYLNISSEALAGTRARGKTRADDFQIGQDLLLSSKEDNEFTIVRDSIKKKLEMICDDVVVHPSKALRKLPRVQHLSAQLAARMRNEDDEFDILNTLHPSPAVCGLPTEEARQFIQDYEIFDRGMYAGPVGWFGGAESEFAVGIRSALLGKGHSTLVYAGAGIVEGTNPSFEWDELDLKASQFAKLLQYQEQHICLQEAENMGTVI
ncbi:isochorismate synthase 1, chloroplastic [Oryza sativa Japonica Group]|uniref:isochorismate synthase n=2 Tax=Oryza sativa subsp. japonica TaxID=39947 RepID=A0A286T796_ORYSJ|nr:isochorismate synthase 1, chloroplastic [Oryza sativa Japonica Group]BBA45711.1 isochorismate synthase [Oryza sativa Japonica Group]